MPRRLVTLGLHVDPVTLPLSYPGALPGESGLLAGDEFLRLGVIAGQGPGAWLVEPPGAAGPGGGVPLDDVLRDRRAAPVAERRPVLAVGSNAAPAQLRRKFGRAGVSGTVPMTLATVAGVRAGVSAHVGRAGYMPATALLAPGSRVRLTVCWLDDEQLAAVDATEYHYLRVRLPGDRFPTVLASGVRLDAADAYAGRHGFLLHDGGAPRPLRPQRELLASLLAESPRLREVLGGTPAEAVSRAAADAAARAAAGELFAAESRVGQQTGLADLADG